MMEVAEVEKRSQLLKIHIPILINFLRDEKLRVNSNQFERQVDNFISFLSSLLFKQGRLKMDSQMHFHNKSHMMQKGLWVIRLSNYNEKDLENISISFN